MIVSNPDLFKALSSIAVLAGTSVAAQTLIAGEGTVHNFLESTWIVREGEEGHAFYLIVEGDVEVLKHAGCSHEVRLATLHQGDVFGEMCILCTMPRAASIRTLDEAKIIEIKAATLHHLYQKMPDQYAIVILNIARDLARRLSQLDEAYAARAC